MSLTKQVLSLAASNEAEKKLIAAVRFVLVNNEQTFKSITRLLSIERGNTNRVDDIKQCYCNVIKVMLDDGIMNWGRMVVIIALAIHLQRVFCTNLEAETSPHIEEFLSDWL